MAIRIRTSAAALLSVTGDWADTPTHARLYVGTDVLDTATITPVLSEAPNNGDALQVVDEGAPFDLTVTGASEAALNAIIAAGLDEVAVRVSLHTAAPTNANEINAANNPGYGRITLAVESLVV